METGILETADHLANLPKPHNPIDDLTALEELVQTAWTRKLDTFEVAAAMSALVGLKKVLGATGR